MTNPKILIQTLLLLLLSVLFFSCKHNYSERAYLQEVLANLNKINSVTYFSTNISSAPGDTAMFSEPRTSYIKIFVNPSDTLVGANSVIYAKDDTIRMTDIYDGKVRGEANWDKQYIKIDSFKNDPYPFRLVYYSFYIKIREIIKYSLNTKDSIRTEFQDFGDSVRFSLKIINKHVYFHIRPIVINNEDIPDGEISQFDIWIRKSDNLPYKMRSKWHHLTYFEICYDAKFNTTHKVDFISTDYFPEKFKIVQFKRKEKTTNSNLEGKIAPAWTVKDLSNNPVRLKDFNSKVLMLQFTGVGCGPCHHSLPFLKQLVENYKENDFEFIAIETWSDNIDGLKRYRDKNKMNFVFLNGDESIMADYDISSVPVFFILDESRVIRKVIYGYSEESTDRDILSIINELI